MRAVPVHRHTTQRVGVKYYAARVRNNNAGSNRWVRDASCVIVVIGIVFVAAGAVVSRNNDFRATKRT